MQWPSDLGVASSRCKSFYCWIQSALGVAIVVALAACEDNVPSQEAAGGQRDGPDTQLSWGGQTVPDQSYTAGTPITPLVLPAATGGKSPLTYSLTPSMPGLQFVAETRTLRGTPSTAGADSITYRVTYRVVDRVGDAATLTFDLRVDPPPVADPPLIEVSRFPYSGTIERFFWAEALSRFIAIGRGFGPNNSGIMYSEDGNNWHGATLPPVYRCRAPSPQLRTWIPT